MMTPDSQQQNSTVLKGGASLMLDRLVRSLPSSLLAKFQIILSRVTEVDSSKIRILWCHDLPEDPIYRHLADGGWKNFHRLVFVSNWQMQRFINIFNIPWSKCHVLQNAIEPIAPHGKPIGHIRLGYWSTPDRGLGTLFTVFTRLAQLHTNLYLDVFSSFDIYGRPDQNAEFETLFDECRAHPHIRYHGAVANAALREALKSIHILAYPSTFQETSCIVLMEAMSAGILAVHPNLGALYETAANQTLMYQYQDRPGDHAGLFANFLNLAITHYDSPSTRTQLAQQKAYCDSTYDWGIRQQEWRGFLESIKHLPPSSS
jgi:UDP-glucose:(glucosyl)LPS alpha-1,2-glucosyltransferase